MLEVLRRRAPRTGFVERLETRLIKNNDLRIQDLKGKVDFVLAFAMVHGVPSPDKFFSEASTALQPGGRMLFPEPSGHVSAEHFANSITLAEEAWLQAESLSVIRWSRAALLVK
jgi:2-polyprenyl-3-methyl-5-hydroxy-6-metoxy-1,4-benzoquinol methylase